MSLVCFPGSLFPISVSPIEELLLTLHSCIDTPDFVFDGSCASASNIVCALSQFERFGFPTVHSTIRPALHLCDSMLSALASVEGLQTKKARNLPSH